jgi:hypothetical protein
MVSEYRALRASVTRLWIDTAGDLTRQDLDDLVRFNEAIDQALAESTARFTRDLSHSVAVSFSEAKGTTFIMHLPKHTRTAA